VLPVLFFLFSHSLFAQNNTGVSRRNLGNYLTLKIAIIGPGDELYFWWGHIGLVIENKLSGEEDFFDWGVFSFDNENFFVNFAFGRLFYSCSVSRSESNYYNYRKTNRDITLYTLDLPPEKKVEILRFAENNMLPENRDYMYHHFRDNCATRIRDILDIALDGQLKARLGSEPGRFTLRQHVRRHTWFNPFLDWILNFWMGQDIDRPITVWDDMFLPSEIGMQIENFRYTGPDGKERPLVSRVETLNESEGRPLVLEFPRRQWLRELAMSLLVSAILFAVYLFYGKKKYYRVFFGIIQSSLGLFFGAAGSLLLFLTAFTDHDYAYHNSNVLFVNPLFLSAIPLGIIFAFSKDEKKFSKAKKLSLIFWVYVLAAGIVTMVIKLFPAFYQQNQVTQALVLPIALAMLIPNLPPRIQIIPAASPS
jgi:hypothetical protein